MTRTWTPRSQAPSHLQSEFWNRFRGESPRSGDTMRAASVARLSSLDAVALDSDMTNQAGDPGPSNLCLDCFLHGPGFSGPPFTGLLGLAGYVTIHEAALGQNVPILMVAVRVPFCAATGRALAAATGWALASGSADACVGTCPIFVVTDTSCNSCIPPSLARGTRMIG
mmetsp:Transcript_20656/g.43423  ORF Transcript_20656/g.43423 Transcript_20656/m.43423 type:complete len:169 (-) Transcript_20656:527-1033(-)